MKFMKKSLAVILTVITVALCFAGCSNSSNADEITAETMLIAYTAENKPFIYEEDGKLKGLDVEVFEKIFKDVKNDFKNYKFVQVDSNYRIGEDVYCVDDNGKECIAYVMVGGVQKDLGTNNEDYTFTENVITNRVITVTLNDSIKTYADLSNRNVGYVGEISKNALDKNSTIQNGFKKLAEYKDTKTALNALEQGKIDAVVVDEFNFCVVDNSDSYTVLNGELETVNYAYAFKKWDWYNDAINEAIHELKSPEYNDADEFTPIVEKYFGYNASSFEYNSVEK